MRTVFSSENLDAIRRQWLSSNQLLKSQKLRCASCTQPSLRGGLDVEFQFGLSRLSLSDKRSESYTMRAGTRAFRELQNAGEDARVPNLLHEQLQIRLVKDWYAG